MSFDSCIPLSALRDLRRGIHEPGDVYKMALFPSSANLDTATTVYSSIGETSGPGYIAGGAVIAGFVLERSLTTTRLLVPDVVWPNAIITAWGVLIYNASKGNRALAILKFGQTLTSSGGAFSVFETEHFVETGHSWNASGACSQAPPKNWCRRSLNFFVSAN